MKRREFIKKTATATGAVAVSGYSSAFLTSCSKSNSFEISLAEWSLHRALQSGKIDHLDFYSVAKNELNISAVEYVNSCLLYTSPSPRD